MKLMNLLKVGVLSLSLIGIGQAQTVPSDSEIISTIQNRFTKEQATSGVKVDVKSENGIVTLSGKVDTDGQASKLIEIAESTQGVKDVKSNNLNIKESNQPFSDMAITAKVKGRFIREKLFGDKDISLMGIKVETTNGTVYLTGNVDTQEQADNAVKLSRNVDGVKKVESKLIVNGNNTAS